MRILFIEPWYGGSHRQLADSLATLGVDLTMVTLPARHWKWRMRGSAVALSGHPAVRAAAAGTRRPDVILASSYLPLAEWRGLVPELGDVPAVLYFHENQLAYPMRPEHSGERDLHYGFTQLVSSLAADECWFNSAHNRDSFLEAGRRLLGAMPDAAPPRWIDRIAGRSHVVYLPVVLPQVELSPPQIHPDGPRILWNHRWEHDKNPERFFEAMFALDDAGIGFRLAVCGQRFERAPAIFAEARARLRHHIDHFDPIEERDEYWELLLGSDVVVSTADHEFFGVSVLEAVHAGARPWVPDRLAYPEIIPERYRWSDDRALLEGLKMMCRGYRAGETLRADRREIVAPFRADALAPDLLSRLRRVADASE
jgi:glycosyltransferase involved in cell wall biosynthesis